MASIHQNGAGNLRLPTRRTSSAPPPSDRDPLEPEGSGISLAEACTSSNTPIVGSKLLSEFRLYPTTVHDSGIVGKAAHDGRDCQLARSQRDPDNLGRDMGSMDALPLDYDPGLCCISAGTLGIRPPRAPDTTGPLVVSSPVFGAIRNGSCTPEPEQITPRPGSITIHEGAAKCVAVVAPAEEPAREDQEPRAQPNLAKPVAAPAGTTFHPAYNASDTAIQGPAHRPWYHPPPTRAQHLPSDKYRQPLRGSRAMSRTACPPYIPLPGPFPVQIGIPSYGRPQRHTEDGNYRGRGGGGFVGRTGPCRGSGLREHPQMLSDESETSTRRSSASPAQLMYQQHQQFEMAFQQQHDGGPHHHQQHSDFPSAAIPDKWGWSSARNTADLWSGSANAPCQRSFSNSDRHHGPNFHLPHAGCDKGPILGGKEGNGIETCGGSGKKNSDVRPLNNSDVRKELEPRTVLCDNNPCQEGISTLAGNEVGVEKSAVAVLAQTNTGGKLEAYPKHRRRWSQSIPVDTSRGITEGNDDDNDIAMTEDNNTAPPAMAPVHPAEAKVVMPPFGDFSAPKPRKNSQAAKQVLERVVKNHAGRNGYGKAATAEVGGRMSGPVVTDEVRKVEKRGGGKSKNKKVVRNKHGHANKDEEANAKEEG